jgi:4-amino-4-deoxy-L-arabinose transferase-like glycosyltransferase
VAALIVLAYAVFRILCIPADPAIANGAGHDGAYLSMVARNLLAGKGFVLDSLWLVLLNPASLPMPYHNANPLYPVAVAGVSRLAGTDVVRAAFLVSALSSAGVLAAVAAILTRFGNGIYRALLIAGFVVVFPVVWDVSWCNITDEFSLMLLLAACAAALRSGRLGWVAVAGLLYGLSWLARSMAIVALPALLLLLVFRCGWRKAALRAAVFSLMAALAAAPWLAHNWRVWGDPLRSDNQYLAPITGYYRHVSGEAVRYWHSPQAPLPMGKLLRLYPAKVAGFWLRSQVPAAKSVITGITGADYLKLLLLAALTALLLAQRWRRLFSPEGAAFLAYAAASAAAMSVMGSMLEPRYVAPGYAIFAAWLGHSALQLADAGWKRPLRTAERGCLLLAGAFAVYTVCIPALSVAAMRRLPDELEKQPLRAAALTVNRDYSHGGPVVVGAYPYLYSEFTGAQALAIPESTDEFLLAYMRKYHARFVLLSPGERDFWRPAWQAAPPPGLSLAGRAGQYYIYRRSGDGAL